MDSFSNISDEELFGKLASKKRKEAKIAFDELYNRYSGKIYSYCRKIMNNDAVADDIFQETFVRVFEYAKKNQKMTNVAGFIVKIARNLCLNEKAKKYNNNVTIENLKFPHYDKTYGKKQLEELLKLAIEDLPNDYKEALILKEFMDMSYKEIAENLDTTIPVVRIRIYRAKNKLKEILSPYLKEIDFIID